MSNGHSNFIDKILLEIQTVKPFSDLPNDERRLLAVGTANLLRHKCVGCGSCCKNPCIGLTERDAERIAKHLKISRGDFKRTYLKRTTGHEGMFKEFAYKFAQTPCKFLVDNRCSVYEVRPEICKQYPNYERDDAALSCLCENDIKKPGLVDTNRAWFAKMNFSEMTLNESAKTQNTGM